MRGGEGFQHSFQSRVGMIEQGKLCLNRLGIVIIERPGFERAGHVFERIMKRRGLAAIKLVPEQQPKGGTPRGVFGMMDRPALALVMADCAALWRGSVALIKADCFSRAQHIRHGAGAFAAEFSGIEIIGKKCLTIAGGVVDHRL